jgi:putative nucleotidyltransferase with HDIG domain
VHHGFRVALLLGLAVLFTTLFPPDPTSVQVPPVGTTMSEEVVAEVGFDVPLSTIELQQARADARATVPPTFEYRPQAADSMEARIGRLLDAVQASALTEAAQTAVREVLTEASIPLSSRQATLLADPDVFRTIRSTVTRVARELVPEGVADATDLERAITGEIYLREPGSGEERRVLVENVLTPQAFFREAVGLLPGDASPDVREILRQLLIGNLEFSYRFDLTATERAKSRAADSVNDTKETIAEGEPVVRANETVTEDTRARLEAYEKALRAGGRPDDDGGIRVGPLVGQTLLNLLLLSVFGLLLYFYRQPVYERARWVLLVSALIAVYAGGAAVVAGNGWPPEALPIAFVALPIAILWDGRMSLVIALALAALTSVQPGFFGAAALVPTAVGGATAALTVRAVRRRSQAWIFIALIASAYAASFLALGLVNGFGPPEDILRHLVAAGANTILATLLAMGFIPVFEMFTGITTDQTLLEWADPNRPLLKRLSMEAPGTYAHTINVANLAEAGAQAIGANGLLCRVGLYYHDVGKMLKPHYFVENQPDGRNPHDKLRPDTSAAIVREHVTEGLRLVREAKVPDVVADFVPEHHGTQRIGFFWEAAVEEFGEASLDPEDFHYPGPRPRSRETAIAMLADSVESATRAMKDPTQERIRGLIESVVDSKIAAGQLDEAPITLKELSAIKDQFTKVLTGVHHVRIDYPETKHLTDAPGPATGESDAEAADAADEIAVSGDEPAASSDEPAASSDEPAAGTDESAAPADDTSARVVGGRSTADSPSRRGRASDPSQLSLDPSDAEREPAS